MPTCSLLFFHNTGRKGERAPLGGKENAEKKMEEGGRKGKLGQWSGAKGADAGADKGKGRGKCAGAEQRGKGKKRNIVHTQNNGE
jgi:hypothetical protein